MVKLSKKLRRKLAHMKHHKGRAGHSRHPFYYTDAMTIPELRKEVHARDAGVIA